MADPKASFNEKQRNFTRELREELYRLMWRAGDLHAKLDPNGAPIQLTQDDKELVRLAMYPKVNALTMELKYSYVIGDNEAVERATEEIAYLSTRF